MFTSKRDGGASLPDPRQESGSRKKHLFSPIKSAMGVVAVCNIVIVLLMTTTNLSWGIPGQWVWRRHAEIELPVFEIIAIVLLAMLSAAIAWFSEKRCRNNGAGMAAGIGMILLLAAIMDWHILLSGSTGIGENLYAVLDEWTTGYMRVAAKIESPREFLSEFHERLDQNVEASNHLDVNPPGRTLVSWFLLDIARRLPEPLRRGVQKSLPGELQDASASIPEYFDRSHYPDMDAAGLAGAFMILLLVLAITFARVCLVAAVAVLNRGWQNLAWLALALSTVPGPVLFIGHYDPLHFGIAACAMLVLACAWQGKHPQCLSLTLGVVTGVGVLLSIGFASTGLFVLAMLAIGERVSGGRGWRRPCLFLAGGAIVVAVCYACGLRIIEVCLLCARNNSRYFAGSGRTWHWIFLNPLDYVVFIGAMPMLSLGTWWSRADVREKMPTFDKVAALVSSVVLGLLFVSPFSRGEMGRLLLLFMPVSLLLFGSILQRFKQDPSDNAWLVVGYGTGVMAVVVMRIALSLVLFF